MDYSKLLKRGRDNLPEIVSVRERFEIEKIRGHHQGNKTILSNFFSITTSFSREPAHVLKYLLKELATSGELKGNVAVFNSKLSSKNINQRIREYANKYVLCYDCGKPDTKILVEEGIQYIKCAACGAKNRLRK